MNGLDLITTSVLGALGCDMTVFLRYFPAAKTMYHIFVGLAIGLILLNWVWQLFKNYGAVAGIEAEDPVKLSLRSILFILLAYFSDDIVNIVLKIGGTPYHWIMNSDLPPLNFADFNSVILVIIGVCANGAVALIALILVLILAWNYIKLLFEAAERYVLLPSIDVHLPIYHGTDDATLQIGIGHLLGSSLPVGGEATHTILTGHSGMASQRMFTDLPQLKVGDIFYLHILDEVLAYQVYFTDEVLPHDTSHLQIVEDRDLCTLVTCTPIGVNTHRLLVMAERIPYEAAEEIEEEKETNTEPVSSWEQNYLKGILIGVTAVLLIALILFEIWLFRRCRNLKARIIIVVVMVLVFLVGAGILAYPYIHGAYVDRQLEAQAIEFLDQAGDDDDIPDPIEPTETEPSEETNPTIATEPREHQELWDAMNAYNENLWTDKQSGLCDPWSYTQPSFTLGDFGLEDEIFGVITIPALDLSMPLYLGATSSHLAAGAAQLSQTSIPIGGINTNAVIAGHRGWNGASYFLYVPDLKNGDKVIITNLWEELTYVVVDTDIIAPNEVEKVLIQDGKDMVTLITCHPYVSGGKQRYVIYCERES